MDCILRYGKLATVTIFFLRIIFFICSFSLGQTNAIQANLRESYLPDQRAKTLSWLPFQ